jgi:DNA-binding MarR family transcriptional regulator
MALKAGAAHGRREGAMARKNLPTVRGTGGDVELLLQFLKLASIISRPMQDEVSERNGLSVNELRVLMCLSGEGAMAGQDIAHVMSMAPMNVSRALAALKRLGWIERVASKGNRRRKPYQLSAAGWKAYAGMLPDIRGVARHLFEPLDRAERRSLTGVFERLIEQLEAWGGEAEQAPRRAAD